MHTALAAYHDTNQTWFGRRIKGCGVVYLCLEGKDDFKLRVRAWRDHHGGLPHGGEGTVLGVTSGREGKTVSWQTGTQLAYSFRLERECREREN